MNTREREVMDALAEALRGWIDAEYADDRSAMAAYDALLAEGSASSEGAEAVAYCDPTDPFNGTAFAWPGTDRTERYSCALYTHPQSAQGEPDSIGAIVSVLNELCPTWYRDNNGTGTEKACAAIRAMAQRSCEGSERRPIAEGMPANEVYATSLRQIVACTYTLENAALPDDVTTAILRAASLLEIPTRPIADEVVERAEKWVCDRCTDPTIERVILDALAHPRDLPAGSDALLTPTERSVIQRLLDVCMHAYHVMDDTEDAGDDYLRADRKSFESLSVAMDALDELPDDQPGYVMNESAKAGWALRRLLDAATTEQPSCGQDARDAETPR